MPQVFPLHGEAAKLESHPDFVFVCVEGVGSVWALKDFLGFEGDGHSFEICGGAAPALSLFQHWPAFIPETTAISFQKLPPPPPSHTLREVKEVGAHKLGLVTASA